MSPADLGQSDNELSEKEEIIIKNNDNSQISEELSKLLRRNIQEFEKNFNKQLSQTNLEESPHKQQSQPLEQPAAVKYIDDFDSDEDQDDNQDFEIINDAHP